jgi:hypothetical protein
MTPDEIAELRRRINRELKELNRPRREAKLRAGLAKPRTKAEWEIFVPGSRVIRVREGEIVSYQDYMDPIAAARLLGRTSDLAAALTAS